MIHTTQPPNVAEDFILYDLELVDAPAERSFDNLTELAARLLNTPCARVAVALESQGAFYIKSAICHARPKNELMHSTRRYRLEDSFCRHVMHQNSPLAVADSRLDKRVHTGEVVHRADQQAYLGVPVRLPGGRVIGVLAVSDRNARNWSSDDKRLLEQIAQCVDEQIALKMALKETERAEERATAAAEARESFLAHMSHEIRTPLNGIIGGVDLLRSEGRESEKLALVDTIDRSAQNLLRLLNDALDLSKIDAGKMELEEAPFATETLARDVLALFAPNARAKGIDLELTLSGLAEGDHRMGDEFRLRQVLSNLVSNAVKFTDQGKVELAIRATGDRLVIRLRDSGCGIPAEQLPYLFEPYSQAEASVARRKGGTGLGLAIVKNIISLMGGTIDAKSTQGEGTEFKLELPFGLVPQVVAETGGSRGDSILASSGRATGFAEGFKGARVLVADDSSANRMLISRMLEKLGAQVVTAEDGEEAMILASDGSFDVLLLDIQMPGMTGLEVIRALRAADMASEGLKDAFAVAVTANVFAQQIETYLAAGFDSYLAKPLRLADLRKVEQKLTQRSPLPV